MPPRTQKSKDHTPFASAFLTQQVWDMKKELKKSDECPICLEDVMKCRHCFSLLACGHVIHTSCFLHCRDQSCPVCRE